MKLDLGGIAKGYAADAAQHVLQKHGITCALVELGGDIVVSGPPPGTEGWTIRVPNAGDDQGPTDLKIAHRAISTSGDTEQFAVIGGRRYSHVVDPRTGQALTNRVQVTVTAPDGLTSDPLSTALSVLGKEDHSKLLRAYPGTTAYVKLLPQASDGENAKTRKGENAKGRLTVHGSGRKDGSRCRAQGSAPAYPEPCTVSPEPFLSRFRPFAFSRSPLRIAASSVCLRTSVSPW
jgi:hypothetical protein